MDGCCNEYFLNEDIVVINISTLFIFLPKSQFMPFNVFKTINLNCDIEQWFHNLKGSRLIEEIKNYLV